MDSLMIHDGNSAVSPNLHSSSAVKSGALERLTTEYSSTTRADAAAETDIIKGSDNLQASSKAANKTQDIYAEIEENNQESLNTVISSLLKHKVKFTTDSDSNISYIEISDKATDELLRTIPSEAMRNVLENINDHIDEILNENIDDTKGVLLDMSS